MNNIKALIQTARPPFLILTPVCVLLGLSLGAEQLRWTDTSLPLLILFGAIFAHISVNMLNEYFDFKSGLDLKTNRTAFSGGSGALPGNPAATNMAFVIGLLSLLVTCLIGIYLVMERGSLILPIGLAGILLVITYTKWINRMPVLCLLAPGLGFGIFMVAGTNLVMTGEYSSLAMSLSLVPFFLLNNLLLLNQYPDIKADSSVGRRTFPIVYGIRNSNIIYALFMIAAYAIILYYIYRGLVPPPGSIALLPLLLSLYALSGAVKVAEHIGAHPRYLAANVAAAVLTPLLLAVSLLNG